MGQQCERRNRQADRPAGAYPRCHNENGADHAEREQKPIRGPNPKRRLEPRPQRFLHTELEADDLQRQRGGTEHRAGHVVGAAYPPRTSGGLRRMRSGDAKRRAGCLRRYPEPHEIGRMLPHRIARAEPLVPVRAVVVQKAAPELGCAVEVETLDCAAPQGVLPHGVCGECIGLVVRGVVAPAPAIGPCAAGGVGRWIGLLEAFPGESKDRGREGLRQVFRLRAREQQVVVALVDLDSGEYMSHEHQRDRREGEGSRPSVPADSSRDDEQGQYHEGDDPQIVQDRRRKRDRGDGGHEQGRLREHAAHRTFVAMPLSVVSALVWIFHAEPDSATPCFARSDGPSFAILKSCPSAGCPGRFPCLRVLPVLPLASSRRALAGRRRTARGPRPFDGVVGPPGLGSPWTRNRTY